MKTFVSDISGKKFPLSDRVDGLSIRAALIKEIQKDYPNFAEDKHISLSELNFYRQQYIANSIKDEVNSLTELEQGVIDSFKRNETAVADTDEDFIQNLTFGQRVADNVASFGGSWKFIILFFSMLVVWITINAVHLFTGPFDPYPFILLNLILSCLAAVQAPVIMMSQNRQEAKDRQRSKQDYRVNLKAELEIRTLHEKLDHLMLKQQQRLLEVQELEIEMLKEINLNLTGVLEKKTGSPKKMYCKPPATGLEKEM